MIIAGLDLSPNSSGVTKFKLDKNYNVIESDYMGFTTVKKNECKNIHYYHPKKSFDNYIEKHTWMIDKIMVFLMGIEYVAIEDYAFSATGRVFHIAEFAGLVKYRLFHNECRYKVARMWQNEETKIRLYDPASIKIYASGRGNCDKITMSESFDDCKHHYKHDLKHLPEVNKSGGNSPTSDIIDSFFICDLLLLELKLRKGLDDLKNYPEHVIKVFNRVTKAHPENILAQDFVTKTT